MCCKRLALCAIVAFASIAWLPAMSEAQGTSSSIAGVVKDTSGAVMPGVTVESASPALIEKVRTAVTDGQGQYKILDLRPGVYAVSFTLPGFNIYKRDNLDLAPGFTATVNAELRVGTLEETVTVSGEAPTVDVQSTKDQKVLSQNILNALPSLRSPVAYVPYLPGVQGGLGQIGRDTANVTIHGNRSLDSNVVIDGFETNSMAGSGGIGFIYNINQGYVQEVAVDVSGMSAELQRSGIRTNLVPKTGGNTYSGFLFVGGGNSSTQADNLTDSLKASGLTAVNSLDKLWDVNPAWGGPIVKDRLWFYNANRYWGSSNYIAGLFYNATPTAWTYTPDPTRQATTRVSDVSASLRLTLQATPKSKVSLFYDTQPHCTCNRNFSSTVSPEATQYALFVPNYFAQATWKYTPTSRLLIESGVSSSFGAWNARRQPGVDVDTISATEQSTGLTYRAANTYSVNPTNPVTIRFTATYVTGSHAAKFGISDKFGRYINTNDLGGSRAVRLNNGVPNQVTLWAAPSVIVDNMNADLGVFAQDQWTHKRLTLNVGLRYDYFNGSVPAQDEAALLSRFGLPNPQFVPVRSYPAVENVPNWKDLSPRMGAVYDLFGNGKTAIKFALGRYVAGQSVEIATANNPLTTSVTNATRTWTDANRNFVVDCDFTNPGINNECGALGNLNFGLANPTATRYADAVTQGYGKRGYNWEGSIGVQRELRPGFSLSATYFRRSYGNFSVTQNTATSSSDYNSYCITAPIDARLPGGGGNQLCGFYDVSVAKFGQVLNLITQASDFGQQEDVYDGVDVTTNLRLPRGITLQGGLNTGRERTNNCFVLGHPNLSGLAGSPNTTDFCDVRPPFQSQVKFLGVYPLPWWGIQTSATYQNLPGTALTATYVATNAQIAPSLGRNLSAGAGGNATLNIIPPGTMYGDRTQELDVSIKKIFSVGRSRLSGGIDIFNLLNRSDILSINNRYGPLWLQATNILTGRWLKFGAQLDF